MKGTKVPRIQHMRSILDIIERLSFLPEPQGVDSASKKYVKEYGSLISDLLEYLQKESVVFWTANGQFEIKSIQIEENMREATVGDFYFTISLHTEEKGNFRNEIASIILKMDEKTHKVWYVNTHGGNYREWNRYNYTFSEKGRLAVENFFKSKGLFELKYDTNGKHPELPIPTKR